MNSDGKPPPLSSEELKDLRMLLKDQLGNRWFFERVKIVGGFAKGLVVFVVAVTSFWAWGVEILKHALGISK